MDELEGPGGGHYENMRGNYSRVACGYYVTPQQCGLGDAGLPVT